MKKLRRFWPVYLSVLCLITTVFLSVRSWKMYDIFVYNRGPDTFPSITTFTVHSCIRIKVSGDTHAFSFDDQSVPSTPGWHTLPNLESDDNDYFWGQFHFKTPWNSSNYDNEVFLGIPIFLALAPGYLPLLFWIWKRREAEQF